MFEKSKHADFLADSFNVNPSYHIYVIVFLSFIIRQAKIISLDILNQELQRISKYLGRYDCDLCSVEQAELLCQNRTLL